MRKTLSAVNDTRRSATRRLLRHCGLVLILMLSVVNRVTQGAGGSGDAITALGQVLFADTSLSHDTRTSCQTCHDPKHAYADKNPRAIGTDQRVGTRNAPSLIGVGTEIAFFWDGRRARLEDVVLDPFTNTVELGLPSLDVVLDRLRKEPDTLAKFRQAFPGEVTPTKKQIGVALARFVRSLNTSPAHNPSRTGHNSTSSVVEHGRQLFEGIAGCAECHIPAGKSAPFSDGAFHDSGVGRITQRPQLPELVKQVVRENLDASALGPKVLSDESWSAVGRFVVTHQPADIGAFRTPSLRNVTRTAPYMHDGSILTLAEAVDHEIYYHSLSRDRPVNLSQADRQEIVAFLESLTDLP